MQKSILSIIGLGNPGKEYRYTRHNFGYTALDAIAKELGIRISMRRVRGILGEGEIDGKKLILLKPTTFMNLSGLSVKALMSRYSIKPKDLLVISDEFNLPLGTIRIRRSGSSGGHKGLASIIGEIGTEEFPRLRIGIGPVPSDVDPIDFVLQKFTPEEYRLVPKILESVRDAVLLLLQNGIEMAMNRYNRGEI